MPRHPLPGAIVCALFTSSLAGRAQAQTITVVLDDTVIAPKTSVGIGVNGGGNWYSLVGANLVDDACFEGPANANGVSSRGWPWAFSGGSATPSLDNSTSASGKQSQKVVVTAAPVTMQQGRVDLPQAPLVMQATPDRRYEIKAHIKAQTAGAQVKLGILAGGWSATLGPTIAVGTDWQEVRWSYTPTATTGLIGFAVQFLTTTTYWVDDFVAYDANDFDPDTGLSAIYVSRLKELKPATLRLGGLGVNGIPLEDYLFRPYPLSYGPPPLSPEMDLNTFLMLCKVVGANPFITVPPAFSDAVHAAEGALSEDIVDDGYVDHGNLVDYLGGEAGSTYGARREAAGFARWDLQFEVIYLELGNELWGTPDNVWDMDLDDVDSLLVQQQRFVRYNTQRMTEMKGRPGWRSNMKVGFCGRDPNVWIGEWPGSYNVTVVPPLAQLTDFSTIGMYYGPTATGSDDALYGDLFAHAQWFERETQTMKAAFYTAAGERDLETTVYEGAAVWGPYAAYLDPATYTKEVSLGAAVSLLDSFAAGNRAGITVNNLFHFNGGVWATLTAYPESYRKPIYFAMQLFTHDLHGDLITCSTTNNPSYNASSETDVPVLGCYAYKEDARYQVLLINRHRTLAQQVHIETPLAMTELVKLTGVDINANNENGETVALVREPLGTAMNSDYAVSVPPFSAYVLIGYVGSPDGGGDGQADSGAAAGDGAAPAGDQGLAVGEGSLALSRTQTWVGTGCACAGETSANGWLCGWAWLLLGLARCRRAVMCPRL